MRERVKLLQRTVKIKIAIFNTRKDTFGTPKLLPQSGCTPYITIM